MPARTRTRTVIDQEISIFDIAMSLLDEKWFSLPLKRCFKLSAFTLAEFDRD